MLITTNEVLYLHVGFKWSLTEVGLYLSKCLTEIINIIWLLYFLPHFHFHLSAKVVLLSVWLCYKLYLSTWGDDNSTVKSLYTVTLGLGWKFSKSKRPPQSLGVGVVYRAKLRKMNEPPPASFKVRGSIAGDYLSLLCWTYGPSGGFFSADVIYGHRELL